MHQNNSEKAYPNDALSSGTIEHRMKKEDLVLRKSSTSISKTKKQGEQDAWLRNFEETTNNSLINHDESLINLEAIFGKLADDIF